MFKTTTNFLLLATLLLALAGVSFGQSFARTGRYQVAAHDKGIYTALFKGGEPAAVYVEGDGDTDLDLYVFDENANLIGKDEDDTDECLVRFTPRWTGKFHIVVVNRGDVYNQFLLALS